MRNVVAVGADPARIALLDNFCWGNTDRPEVLGSLVRAAEACRDIAVAYRMPFISGKDSLNNEFHAQGRHIVIPPTLLISAMGIVPDVRRCVTMDLKEPGNVLFLVGTTRDEMGGSHYHLVTGQDGGRCRRSIRELAPRIFAQAARSDPARAGAQLPRPERRRPGGRRSRRWRSRGGIGADVDAAPPATLPDEVLLFCRIAERASSWRWRRGTSRRSGSCSPGCR